MNLYVLLNLLILIGPLALSFDKKVAFYKRWLAALPAISLVALVYLFWDVFATLRGDWSFNPLYAGTFTLFGLPLGEILFFICVPYACLFVYEVIRGYLPEKTVPFSPRILVLGAFVFTAGGFLFIGNDYSALALFSCAVFCLIGRFLKPEIFRLRSTWLYFLITYLPFLLCNGILTAVPIVEYADHAIWGLRVYTIPLEDFFYNFSLLGLNLLVYRLFLSRRHSP